MIFRRKLSEVPALGDLPLPPEGLRLEPVGLGHFNHALLLLLDPVLDLLLLAEPPLVIQIVVLDLVGDELVPPF